MDQDGFLFGSGPDELGKRREVKVRVPVELLLQLHGIKLVSGDNVSESVIKALDVYFAHLEDVGLDACARP